MKDEIHKVCFRYNANPCKSYLSFQLTKNIDSIQFKYLRVIRLVCIFFNGFVDKIFHTVTWIVSNNLVDFHMIRRFPHKGHCRVLLLMDLREQSHLIDRNAGRRLKYSQKLFLSAIFKLFLLKLKCTTQCRRCRGPKRIHFNGYNLYFIPECFSIQLYQPHLCNPNTVNVICSFIFRNI